VEKSSISSNSFRKEKGEKKGRGNPEKEGGTTANFVESAMKKENPFSFFIPKGRTRK